MGMILGKIGDLKLKILNNNSYLFSQVTKIFTLTSALLTLISTIFSSNGLVTALSKVSSKFGEFQV